MMKRLLLALLCSIWAMAMTAQINPVENLSWDQSYNFSHNNFVLEWLTPNSPHDVILGYNVYRGDELYRFQTQKILYNNYPTGGQNCPESFLLYGNGPFWIHVTAVYEGQIESGYVDSVFTQGAAFGVKDIRRSRPVFYPNPTTGKLTLAKQNIKQIILFDLNGKFVKKIKPKPEIDLSGISKGIYFIRLFSEEGEVTEKLVVD